MFPYSVPKQFYVYLRCAYPLISEQDELVVQRCSLENKNGEYSLQASRQSKKKQTKIIKRTEVPASRNDLKLK